MTKLESERSRLRKLKRIRELEREKRMKEDLPHLYGFPHYKWSRKFYSSPKKECFLTAANQIGKSSIQIRKMIHWATEDSLWTELWPTTPKPNLFWYLYPTKDVATEEFKLKWSQFLPRNTMQHDPKYGWKAVYDKKTIRYLEFNSGVNIYFKSYSQNVQDLQTGTVYYIGCDEELPVTLFPELQARVNATDGYFSLVFTATLGQEYWRKVMEPFTPEEERQKDALKISVSLMDCLEYEDGSKTPWNQEKIKRAIEKCPSEREVQRRIYGKFVKSEGLKYSGYDAKVNCVLKSERKKDWLIYSAVDIGSGGTDGHPSAIIFIAVSPDFKKAEVFKSWRGDNIDTTAGDVLEKYVELKGDLEVVMGVYDWASKDFKTIADRAGVAFSKAEKNHEIGCNIVNTAFKYRALSIVAGEYDNDKLSMELCSIDENTPKRNAKDDLADTLRYACVEIPFDFSDAVDFMQEPEDSKVSKQKDTHLSQVDRERNAGVKKLKKSTPELNRVQSEINEWQGFIDE